MERLPADFPLPPGVTAFFTTRKGGVSDPPFHSLNMSLHVGDDADAVYENRMRLSETLPSGVRWLRQTHGARVLAAEDIVNDTDVADACITAEAGVVCAVQTADCLPVLFYHEDGAAVGAAHAGWRGLAAGVLANTAAAMRERNPSPLHACIGPCISAAHYIVGAEVRSALCEDEEDAEAFTAAEEEGKFHADLARLAARRLRAAGAHTVYTIGVCTYAEPKLLFSARRDGDASGRQAAVIYRGGGV